MKGNTVGVCSPQKVDILNFCATNNHRPLYRGPVYTFHSIPMQCTFRLQHALVRVHAGGPGMAPTGPITGVSHGLQIHVW